MITGLHSSAARLYTAEAPGKVFFQEQTATTPSKMEGIPNNISNLHAFDDPNAQKDSVELSNEARSILQDQAQPATQSKEKTNGENLKQDKTASSEKEEGARPGELTDVEKKEVKELKNSDQRVKAHEAAHKAVGGQYISSGVSLQYTNGPDGQRYAVAGEVSIDVSEIRNDPEATARKMETVRRAALAPQDPSPQDRRVAAEASRKAAQARAEIAVDSIDEPSSQLEGSEKSSNEEVVPLEEFRNETRNNSYNPEAETYARNSREIPSPGSFLELVA